MLSRRFGRLEPRTTSMRLAIRTPPTATPPTPTTTPPTPTLTASHAAPSEDAFPGYHPCTLLSEILSLRTIHFGAAEVEEGMEGDPNP